MRRVLLAASLAVATAGPTALAQGLGDPLLSATITQSLVADSNFGLDDPSPGASYYADTRLILGLLNATPNQTFALGLDTGLRALWEADEDFDLTFASPSTATLDYGYEWASGTADVFLNYRQRDLDTTFLDATEFTDDVTGAPVTDIREVQADATERRYNGGFSLALATQSRSSYELDFESTRFDYSGDENATRTPRSTYAGDALWLLRFSPVLTGTFGGGYSRYEAENAQETRIRQGEVEAGVIYDPSEALQLRFGAGVATYKREQRPALGNGQFGTRQTVDDDTGYVLRGRARYAFEEATVNAELRLTNAAPETRLSGFVQARYPLPNGALTGRVFQRYGGGDTGQEIRVTGAAIGLEHEINRVSGVSFDVNVARQEDLDTNDPDTNRLNFIATYSRALTEVVSANVGYRFRARDEDPASATSNAVFLEIGRSFVTRP